MFYTLLHHTVVPLLLPRALRPRRELLLGRLAARVDAVRDQALPDHILADVEEDVAVAGLDLWGGVGWGEGTGVR